VVSGLGLARFFGLGLGLGLGLMAAGLI